MKVLHVTNAYPYSSVPEYGVFVKEQVESLAEIGVDVEVYFINGREKGGDAYYEAVRSLRKRAAGFDLVHCHHALSGLASAMALVSKPIVLSFQNDYIHELENVPYIWLRKLMCRIAIHRANRVIFKCPIPKQFVGSLKFAHLPNGVNASHFPLISRDESLRELGLDPSNRYILFVSSKDLNRPQKRFDRFHEVVAEVKRERPDLRPEPLVLTNVARERVKYYFGAADLHLLTSDFEGSPNSVKEAVTSGRPVISTPVGNVSEMIHGVPGCHVVDFSVLALAAAVIGTLTSMPDRKELREAFLDRGLRHDIVARKLADLYEELLRSRS